MKKAGSVKKISQGNRIGKSSMTFAKALKHSAEVGRKAGSKAPRSIAPKGQPGQKPKTSGLMRMKK